MSPDRRLRDLDDTADLDNGLALGDQLLGSPLLRRSLRLELADDLLGCVPGAFHGRVPVPVWSDEDSHSPWTECWGPRHADRLPMAHIRLLVHVALLLALALVLLKPQRLLAVEAAGDALLITPRLHLAMAGVGFWTGLIVLDAASYLLVSLVLIGRVALQQANAMKAVLIGLATLVSVMVFVQGGEVDWGAALPLVLGSAVGGWAGATLALGPKAKLWIYRLLVTALAYEVAWMVWRLTVS